MAYGTCFGSLLICALSIFLGFPSTASAQGDGMIIIVECLKEVHKVADLSLGFSMARTTNPLGGRLFPLGLQFGSTIQIKKSIGIDVDFAGQSRKIAGSSEQFNMFEYLFGPRLNILHAKRTTVFIRILVGGVNYSQNSSVFVPATYKKTGFAIALGGGFDIQTSKSVAIRVAQFDWIPYRDNGSWKTNTVRFGFGIVSKSAKNRS
jgi:hypothetical protein